MAYIQNGVLEKSKMFFYSRAQRDNLFYYPLSAGHFYCTGDYRIERERFDSILVLFVVRGSFSFVCDGKICTAHSGEAALVDCFCHHMYFTDDSLEAYWLHISGSSTYELYNELKLRGRSIISLDEAAEHKIKDIYSIIKNNSPCSDSEMSMYIYSLLISFFDSKGADGSDDCVNTVIRYINENYADTLTVSGLSDVVHLSASQLSRKFKKQTGTSPYSYILSVRLTRAKELLKNTSLPISEVAYRTGFSSDANFIYFFKRQEGISPLRFRSILF